MAAPEPNVRYFDAHTPNPRRWLLIGALTALVLVAIGVVVRSTTGWFDAAEPAAGAVAPGELPEGGAAGDVVEGDDATDDDVSDTTPAAAPTSVIVVGDSITQGSRDEIRFVLSASGFTDVTVDGLTSRRIEAGGGGNPESGIQAIYRMLSEGADPDVWVVALGTNDIGKYRTDEEYAALVDFVLDVLPEEKPVVWVDCFRDDYAADSDRFNAVLEAALDRRDGAVMVRWHDAVMDDPGLLRDGVHPDRDGEAVFAMLIGEALNGLR